MNPIVLVAALGVGLWIWGRAKAAAKPPSVVSSPTGAGTAENAGATDAAKVAAEGNMGVLTLTAKGAAAGMVLGPIGSALGAAIGAFVGEMMNDDDWRKYPWETWGMPYYADAVTTVVDEDGVERLHVPIKAVDSVYPSEVRISTAALRALFPGPGAYEACRDSGMFCWRPREVTTPFSAILHGAAPWLTDYEDQYLWGFFCDGDSTKLRRSNEYQGDCDYRNWFSANDLTDTTGKAVRVSLNIARRLWAGVAYYGVPRMAAEVRTLFSDDWKVTGGLQSYLHNYLAPKLTSGVHVRTSPRFGSVIFECQRALTFCGFPGAWCFVDEPATITTLKPAPETPSVTYAPPAGSFFDRIHSGSMTATTRGAVRQFHPAAAAAPAGHTDLKIAVWWPSWGTNVTGDDAPNHRESDIWGHREVIPLQLFIDSGVYSSEAEIVAELAAGTFVWGPNWTSKSRSAWLRVEPTLGADWMEYRRLRAVAPSTPDGQLTLV